MQKISLLLLFSLVLSSCEKIIDVDLNTANPITVVDAALCSQDDEHTIILSTTGRFTDGEGLSFIENATVSIDDGNGQTATFTEGFPGIYTLQNYALNTGLSYNLTVMNGEETITAISEIVPQIAIDSIYFEEGFFGTPEGEPIDYNVRLIFQDPAGTDNYYRVLVTVNDTLQKRTLVTNDNITDGQLRDLNFNGSDIYEGDTVMVELWTIDKAGYDYYSTLQDISSGGGFSSSTPYNPITNLSSGLGHFTVYQRFRRTVVVAL